MTQWRKIIVSGSDAELLSITASSGINIGDEFIYTPEDGLFISSSAGLEITGSVDIFGPLSATEISGSFSGSFTGEFEGEIPPLKVSGSDNTEFSLNITSDYLRLVTASENGITITTDEINTVTFGLANDISITGNLTVGGDLLVEGDVTEVQTTNLLVEDRFILLNSGSVASMDPKGGIIIDEGGGSGSAFFYTSLGGVNRWSLAHEVEHDAITAIPTAYLAAVVDMAVSAHSESVEMYEQIGNIKIEDGEIFIYA